MNHELDTFFNEFPIKRIKKGIILADPFTRPAGIYHLVEGFVRQYSNSEEGKELTIHIYSPSSYFPMFWAFDLYPNRHYFQAMTPLQVHIIPKDRMLSFFRNHPESSIEFMKRLLLGINGLTKRLEATTYSNARLKIISVLFYLASHFGEDEGNVLRIHEHFTHERIATISGLTREHVSLELEKLQKEKLITIHDHELILPDVQKLKEGLPF